MKTAIVTGSSRGIGRSIAQTLAKHGHNVVVNSRNQKSADKTAQEISKETGAETLGVEADIRDISQVRNLVKRTLGKFKRIDVLVNNAGIVVAKTLAKTSEKDWDLTLDTNLKGTYLCTKAVLPYLIKQRSGHIVNISSGAGKKGFPELSAYCASKFGVIGFAKSVAEEVSSYNINIVTICPGAVATDMQRNFMTKDKYESRRKFMIQPREVSQKILDAINEKFPSGSTVDL